jgi:hypothetical protein
MRVKTVYRFVDIDKPDDFIDITTYGDGIDSGDKAPGKAMTYGDKYALLKAYKIITGDDPDQTASEEGKTQRTGEATKGGYKGESAKKTITAEQRKFMIWRAQTVYGDKTIGNKELVALIRKAGYNDAQSISPDAYNRIIEALNAKEAELKKQAENVVEDSGMTVDEEIGQMGLPFK